MRHTIEAMLAEAIKYEALAKDMKLLGDHAAAHAFFHRCEGCLEYAMELELKLMDRAGA